MTAYLVAGVRTPFGRYGGALAGVRPDDLAAHAVGALTRRLPSVDWDAVDDVVLGCANQAGEDNRNVARMAALLAGLPVEVPGTHSSSTTAGPGGRSRPCASVSDKASPYCRRPRRWTP